MVNDQAKEWTDLITNQMKENAKLNTEQLGGQLDMLKEAAEAMQQAQLKTLETHFEKQVFFVVVVVLLWRVLLFTRMNQHITTSTQHN